MMATRWLGLAAAATAAACMPLNVDEGKWSCRRDADCGEGFGCSASGFCLKAEAGPSAEAAPPELVFEPTYTGYASAPKTVTVAGTARNPLHLTSVNIAPPFEIGENRCTEPVAMGADCTLAIVFRPTTPGTHTAVLELASDSTKPLRVGLSGTALLSEPSIALEPSTLAFGNQRVGTTSAPRQMVLTNTGRATLTMQLAFPAGFAGTGDCTGSVPAGGHCTLDVTFTPLTEGLGDAGLTITDNAQGSPHTARLTGTGNVGRARLQPQSLSFVEAVGATSPPQEVTVSNEGADDLKLLGFETSAPFSISANTCADALAPSASCTLSITFAPTALPAVSQALLVRTDGAESQTSANLQGSGTGAIASISPSSPVFSDTYEGDTSSVEVVLRNDGNVPLVVSARSATPPFQVAQDGCASVDAGGSCTLVVAFHPQTAGPAAGELRILTNSLLGDVVAVLQGTALAAFPVADLYPEAIDFGPQKVGGTKTGGTVILGNHSGHAALVVAAVDFGAQTGVFAQTNNCAPSVAPGGECRIAVTFTPDSVGTHTGTLRIADNAAGSPRQVNLTGTGVASTAQLSATAIDFGDVAVRSSSTRTVNVANGSSYCTLVVSGVTTASPFAVSNNGCTAPVGLGEICQLAVTFSPDALGAASGTLTIAHDGSNSPSVVTLGGRGTGARAVASTATLAFGESATGSDSTARSVSISNSGNADLHVATATATGSFVVSDNGCTAPVAPGASCPIALVFRPVATGAQSGSLVVASDSLDGEVTVELSGVGAVHVAPSDAKNILAFTIDGRSGTFGGDGGTDIAVELPFGTDSVTDLAPAIVPSEGATLDPESGAPQDFTNPVEYTVTAADGSKKVYRVTVTVALDPAKAITQFDFQQWNNPALTHDAHGVIDQDNHAVAVAVPAGTDVTVLKPTIAFDGAGVDPVGGASQDFTDPVNYEVTAADGSAQTYTVTVTVAP